MLKQMLKNGCNDFLFGVHCVEEGDHIPPLQSYGWALKQENCFSGVLGDYYAALLPKRGPHYASHSVCLSVRQSRYRRSRIFGPASVTDVLFGTH